MPGVVRTRVGYAGGDKENPTYHELGDHTEALQLEYDTEEFPYIQLLNEIFSRHDPGENTAHRQYQNVIWYHDEAQQQTIEHYVDTRLDKFDSTGDMATRVEPLEQFWRAEQYHQKYYLQKQAKFMDAFNNYSADEFTDSTLAGRLNGIIAGNPTSPELFEEVCSELPEELEQQLRSHVKQ
ncbi:MAG: peptide-methionine (S)-S-oxide reductase [bacterium]